MKNILDRLKLIIREKAEGKHTVFAKNAGISVSTFQFNMDGRPLNTDTLLRIRKTYGVNIDWLLTGDGEPYDTSIVNCFGSTDPETAGLLRMAQDIIASNTSYGFSLKVSIRSYHQAIQSGQRDIDLEDRMRILENQEEGGANAIPMPDRRLGQRRKKNDPDAIPGKVDRRTNPDRRVAGSKS